MKIGLFGYGKMGKMIEQLSEQRGHQIVARIDEKPAEIPYDAMDVAIDFSVPASAVENIKACLDRRVPVICGTTGWLDRYEEVRSHCLAVEGAFLYASNFSLGVNIFFELNRILAGMIADSPEYQVTVDETHHIHKLDAPSGTAITLAEGIINSSTYHAWQLEKDGKGTIPIYSRREGEVPGTHVVRYSSAVDDLSITHEAHSREGFALGAVVAAEWILGKTGVYTMKDVLNLGGK